ncbi:MAG: hypothetical protein IPM54_22840 [Polyangiaceae bacterium]|nr:hypothetical protein [Polyangiaceae bacterium]
MSQREREHDDAGAASWDAPSSKAPSGYARVAVVQLAYLPAALRDRTRSALYDPLFDIEHPAIDSTLPTNTGTAPDAIAQEHKSLRARIREQYTQNLWQRVKAILDACRRFFVELVVFPEYSIPSELLEQIAQYAPDVVVVAGTHAVEATALKNKVYARLDWPQHPSGRQSVCPVLFGGKLIGLQPKLSPAKPEHDIMLPGDRWEPIVVSMNAVNGPMGVLICLDFLDPDAEPYRVHVAERIKDCAFVAVPSLTPFYSLGDFQARFRNAANLHQRPVLYCNIASQGGTTVHISDERERRERHFPEYIGMFDAGDEGVIIADIRLAHGPLGHATTNPHPPLLRPVAAASLLYRSISDDARYANWRDTIGTCLAGVADDDFEAIQEIAVYVREADALLRSAGKAGMRKRRLALLRAEIESATDVEWIKQLTREVVLPPHVLPWSVLQGALARGAADVARVWSERDGEGLHAFAEVAARLRKAVPRDDTMLSKAGRDEVDAIEKAVRADAPRARDPRTREAVIRVYETIAESTLDKHAEQAKAALRAGEYAKAERFFREALETATRITNADPKNIEAATRAATNQLNLAVCVLNRQANDEGKALLDLIDPALLSPRGRCTFSEALAAVGNLDRARSVLPSEEEALSDEDRARLRDTQQILAILAGKLPDELSSSLHVQRVASELLLERDDFAGAAEYAICVIEGSEADQLVTASAFSVLSAALRWSMFEDPPNAAFIRVEAREACVRAIESALSRIDFERLPEGMRERVGPWRASYLGLVFDIDAILASGNPLPPAHAEPSVQARVYAADLAGKGKLEEALATLPSEDHPWRTRYMRIELMAIAGATTRALEEALLLAREFPGRAPIAYQVAALLHNAGRAEEALPHAGEAFRLLPGIGQRLLLARCLLEQKKAQRAWELLQPLRETRSSRVLLLLAQSADGAVLHEAPRLWERYLGEKPDDGTARVRYAQALFKVDKREEAAAVACDVLKQAPRVLGADAIFTAATLVRMKGDDVDESAREHIERAVTLLRERFPGDAQAEMHRLQLQMLLGELSDSAPIDYGLLVQAGLGELVPFDETVARLEQARQTEEAAISFYRAGGIPFNALIGLASPGAARLVVQWLQNDTRGGPRIAAPARPSNAALRAIQSIEGKTILVSDLELLLLEHLKLLELLRDRLGASGRIALFSDVHRRILEDATNQKVRASMEPRAADLADKVRAFVARGIRDRWLERIEKPQPSQSLPPLRGELTEAARKLGIEPLEDLLATRTVMEQDPSWLRVSADACGSDYIAHRDIVQMFEWHSNRQFLDLSQWNRELAERDLHLPDLVRLLMKPPRLDEKLLELARIGFADALHAEELVNIAQQPGGLDRSEIHAILEGVESTLHGGRAPSAFARLQVANAYGATIWDAFNRREEALTAGKAPVTDKKERLPEHLFEEADAKALALFVLNRVEAIDNKVAPSFLDQVLMYAVGKAVENPAALMKETDAGSLVLDETTRGHAFYAFLYGEWAAGNPTRRAAMGRAVVDALLLLDELCTEDGPKRWEIAALTPTLALGIRGGGISLEDPEIEAAAILSSQWSEPVLGDLTINVGKPITIDEVLAYGASILGQSKEIGGNERTWFYKVPIDDGRDTLGVFVPVEAILLRDATSEHARREIAMVWSLHQGIHDGRAHRFLRDIADHPQDRKLQHEYARFTVKAPWRLIRDDPSFFLQFTDPHPFGRAGRLLDIQELRAMLSEPEQGMFAARSVAEALAARVLEGGDWRELPYARELFLQAAAVPGNTVAMTLGTRLGYGMENKTIIVEDVQGAMDRLARPEEHPIAQLAGDLCFLQFEALQTPRVRLREGEIDLREETPNLAAKLLESVVEEKTKKHFAEIPRLTFAEVEGALLRQCSRVVLTIAQRSTRLPKRDLLWLTYRLYQWLVAELERIAPDEHQAALRRLAADAPKASLDAIDILDPLHFDRELFDHRLATVLYTLALGEELIRGQAKEVPPRVSSAAIEERLLELVQRDPRGVELSSVLDWFASPEIPDLALMALLRADMRALEKVPARTRLRFLKSLASSFPTDDMPHGPTILTRMLVMAVSDISDKLEAEERAALEASVRRMDDTAHGRLCKAFALTGLFGPNAPHLEAEARASLLVHIDAKFAPILFGRFLAGIAVIAPDRLMIESERLLASIEERRPEHQWLVPVALARVIMHGPVAVRTLGRNALVAVAAKEPFMKDPNLDALLGHLGLKRENP